MLVSVLYVRMCLWGVGGGGGRLLEGEGNAECVYVCA